MAARYPAGIITSSDGTGNKLDSSAMRKNIPAYDKPQKRSRIEETSWATMGFGNG
jgi:hypothetical protein